jgi:hypothetical protein
MFRFTIRDVLWLMVVVAMALAWWADRNGLYLHRSDTKSPMVVLARRTKAAHTVTGGIGGTFEVPAYEYGEVTIHNSSIVAMELSYGMSICQYFTPIIRLESGEVLSSGKPLGRTLSVLTPGTVTIAPGKSHKVELTMWDESLRMEGSKPGTYYLRVQFHYDGKVWESNEIMLNRK